MGAIDIFYRNLDKAQADIYKYSEEIRRMENEAFCSLIELNINREKYNDALLIASHCQYAIQQILNANL